MEMRSPVAQCQRAADWTLAWMVEQMFAFFFFFFKFKLAQKFGSGASSAARTLPWTPALLTPTWCVHVSGCYCINYLKYGAAFILCASCTELSVCACNSGEPEKKDLTSFSNALPAFCSWSVFLPKFFTCIQTMNLHLTEDWSAVPDVRQHYLWCMWLSFVFDLAQGRRMWVDLDGTLSHLPRHS